MLDAFFVLLLFFFSFPSPKIKRKSSRYQTFDAYPCCLFLFFFSLLSIINCFLSRSFSQMSSPTNFDASSKCVKALLLFLSLSLSLSLVCVYEFNRLSFFVSLPDWFYFTPGAVPKQPDVLKTQ